MITVLKNTVSKVNPLILLMSLIISLPVTVLFYVNIIVPYYQNKGNDIGIYFPIIGIGIMVAHLVAGKYLMKNE
jgi:hypothetical protein